MNFLGLELSYKNIPPLDTGFVGAFKFFEAFEKATKGKTPVSFAIERESGKIAKKDVFVFNDGKMNVADILYVKIYIKTILWAWGGFKITIDAPDYISDAIVKAYSPSGERAFDAKTMGDIYEQPFTVVKGSCKEIKSTETVGKKLGGSLSGCRIGFDAGGSDRKVSAVIDGEAVFSEEVVWFPKINEDPDYHYEGIVSAMKKAAEHMPRVDSIGVSSAGVYVNNRTMLASLFIKVPKDLFDQKVKDIYIRAANEVAPNVPVSVVNDGDVTALAGAMELEDNGVLGIAMGTSEAGGYVDTNGCITGCLNELAFVPVDLNPSAALDEWSGDIGCGVKYFSQDAVIRLAEAAGIRFDPQSSPAEKLKVVQELMEKADPRIPDIYKSIGIFLAHSICWYNKFYDIKHVLLLGRVMSGEGGVIIFETAKKVLLEEYPEQNAKITLHLPDEKSRRVGQSVAAASL